MKNVKFLSEKEKKNVQIIIRKNYSCKIDFSNYEIFKTSKEKIWICNKGIAYLIKKLPNIKFFGLFFGKIKKNNKIQLSLEGSQIVGKDAKKNIIEILNLKEAEKYVKEDKIPKKAKMNVEEHNFAIVKFNHYFLGSAGVISRKEIKSFFPKSRLKMIR